MADRAISALPTATTLTATDLFVLSQSNQAKNTTWQTIIGYLTTALDGHGGIQSITKTSTSGVVDTYTVTLADTTTYTFTVTNGDAVSSITQYYAVSTSDSAAPTTWYTTLQTMTPTNKYLWSYIHYEFESGNTLDSTAAVIGVYGDTGQAWYVHIKYASQEPTQDSDMGDIPDNWIGIYSGTSATPPTSYTSYDWFEYKGKKGDTGEASAITSQSVTYMESTSGTVVPSGSWTPTIPSVSQGNFLWTRTVLNFNDGSSVTSYSVARYGVDGTGSVSAVNNVGPDGTGNISLNASDIPTSNNDSIQQWINNLDTKKADLTVIAGVESSSAASKTYTAGEYLVMSGVLYEVTVDISLGDTITVGTNVQVATVGGALTQLKNTLNHLEDGLAIIVNGDTCSTAVPIGGYAYIKNNTHGLAEGLYTNTSASAFPTSGGTANSSVFTAVSGGGLNSLKDSLLTVDSYSSGNVNVSKNGKTVFLTWGSATLDSDGKTFTTVLPVRFRPSREVMLSSKCYNGSTYVDCRALVTTSGVISLTDFSNKKIDNIQPAFFQTSPVVYCSN